MTITMNDSHLVSIAHLRELLKITIAVRFKGRDKNETYEWIGHTIGRFRYFSLRKKERSVVKGYLMAMTGLSRAQITRLIARKKQTGCLFVKSAGCHRFARRYTPGDVAVLVGTDNVHDRLSGPATKRIFERMYREYGDVRFERLQYLPVSHLYNLRGTRQYESHALTYTTTNPVQVPIGERRKPDPCGKPGYLRVDTVHQGDSDKEKGVYHVNIVDEVTQWELVGAVEKISEAHLAPLLENLLGQFPFRILGFHSDNGSEYINKVVARLLNKLMAEQTKSRSRHCNDNALVEGKNGSIVRKHMGRGHIAQRHARLINRFYENHLNAYLNFHRPCGFATTKIDRKGKEKKVYDIYRTPFEALVAHPRAPEFLKDGVTMRKLQTIAENQSDNECAALMREAKEKLFTNMSNQRRQS